MKLLFVADPLETFKTYKDTTFAMMREAHGRGHELSVLLQEDLIWRHGAVTGDARAYRYLVESIRRFPAPEAFAQMMRTAGFARVSFERMTGGVVTLHSGWRL